MFEEIYGNMEKHLHHKRKGMAEIIEIANTAYEQRDKVQEKLAILLHQSNKEKAEFTKEIKGV